MKPAYTLGLIVLFLLPIFTQGQNWQSVGSGCGTNDQSEYVLALTVYHNQLIAAGKFASAGGQPAKNIAAWDGFAWHPLGSGLGSPTGYARVTSLAEYHGSLYAAGTFSSAGGIPAASIAKWDGTSWSPVGDGIPYGGINALAVFNDQLYAGGQFFDTIQDSIISGIERWNGTQWSYPQAMYCNRGNDVIHGVEGAIESLYSDGTRLYMGGNYQSYYIYHVAGTVLVFQARNLGFIDTTDLIEQPIDTVDFNGVRYGGSTDYAHVLAICDFQGKLLFSGRFDTAGSAPADDIAGYAPGRYQQVPNPTGGPVELRGPLYPYQGKLLTETLLGSGVGVSGYDGATWTLYPGSFTGTYPGIRAFCEYNGELYAGGIFSQAGQTGAINIAKWSASAGISETQSESFQMYPYPAKEAVTVHGLNPNADITVTDVVGRTILNLKADANGSKTLDLSNLRAGLYMLNGRKLVKE
ncbi:MAG: T9SS type A sorting domain-containing protein [Bacteroidetes bacterium]|nr:T9SS type A sorting domain-containing protein [Bacteroidota bacterium]